MSRPLRLAFPGVIYHVTSRGNARAAIYLDDKDRQLFLRLLANCVEKFHWICHAYCLMDNHYHLLIETPDANLQEGMRQLNGIYTQQLNREHARVGHVFKEDTRRFWSTKIVIYWSYVVILSSILFEQK
jgi:REP element-mobilizing transposase RayT